MWPSLECNYAAKKGVQIYTIFMLVIIKPSAINILVTGHFKPKTLWHQDSLTQEIGAELFQHFETGAKMVHSKCLMGKTQCKQLSIVGVTGVEAHSKGPVHCVLHLMALAFNSSYKLLGF